MKALLRLEIMECVHVIVQWEMDILNEFYIAPICILPVHAY